MAGDFTHSQICLQADLDSKNSKSDSLRCRNLSLSCNLDWSTLYCMDRRKPSYHLRMLHAPQNCRARNRSFVRFSVHKVWSNPFSYVRSSRASALSNCCCSLPLHRNSFLIRNYRMGSCKRSALLDCSAGCSVTLPDYPLEGTLRTVLSN